MADGSSTMFRRAAHGDVAAWYNVTVNDSRVGTLTLEGEYGLANHYASIEATAEALQMATDNARDMDVAYLVICGGWQQGNKLWRAPNAPTHPVLLLLVYVYQYR